MTKAPFTPTTTYAVAPTRSFFANIFKQSTRLARVLKAASRTGNIYLNNNATTNKRTTLKLFSSCQFRAKHLVR